MRKSIFQILKQEGISDSKKITSIEALIKNNPNCLNEIDDSRNSAPLHAACLNCGADMFKWLIQKKPELLSARDVQGANVLMRAASDRNQAAMNYLLELPESDSLARAIDDFYYTCLSYAVKGGDVSILQQLQKKRNDWVFIQDELDAGAEEKEINTDRLSKITDILTIATTNGHLDMVKFLFDLFKDEIPEDKSKLIQDPYTLIHWAALNGHTALVKFFVKECAIDPRAKSNRKFRKFYMTPIALACEKGHLDTVTFLLKYEPPVTQPNHSEMAMLLRLAAKVDNVSILKLLFAENKMDIDVITTESSTLLQSAITSNASKAVKWLLEKGASIKLADEGKPGHALGMALKNIAVTKCLIEHNADVNSLIHIRRNYIISPLHLALKYDYSSETVKELINARADWQKVKMDNNLEISLLHLAASQGNLAVARYLIEELNCSETIRNDQGRTPLDEALRNGKINICLYLYHPYFLKEIIENPATSRELSAIANCALVSDSDPSKLLDYLNFTNIHYQNMRQTREELLAFAEIQKKFLNTYHCRYIVIVTLISLLKMLSALALTCKNFSIVMDFLPTDTFENILSFLMPKEMSTTNSPKKEMSTTNSPKKVYDAMRFDKRRIDNPDPYLKSLKENLEDKDLDDNTREFLHNRITLQHRSLFFSRMIQPDETPSKPLIEQKETSLAPSPTPEPASTQEPPTYSYWGV